MLEHIGPHTALSCIAALVAKTGGVGTSWNCLPSSTNTRAGFYVNHPLALKKSLHRRENPLSQSRPDPLKSLRSMEVTPQCCTDRIKHIDMLSIW